MQTDLREKEAVLQKKLDPESHFSAICPNESGNGGGTLQNAALPCGKILGGMLQSGQKKNCLPETYAFFRLEIHKRNKEAHGIYEGAVSQANCKGKR